MKVLDNAVLKFLITHNAFAELVLMLRPPGPLAERCWPNILCKYLSRVESLSD